MPQVNVSLPKTIVDDTVVGKLVAVTTQESKYGQNVVFEFLNADGRDLHISVRLSPHPNSALTRFLKSLAEAVGVSPQKLVEDLNSGKADYLDNVWFVLSRQPVSFGTNKQTGEKIETTMYLAVSTTDVNVDDYFQIDDLDRYLVSTLATSPLISGDPAGEILFRAATLDGLSPDDLQKLVDRISSDASAYLRRLVIAGLLTEDYKPV